MKKYIYVFAFILLAIPSSGQNYITSMEYWFDSSFAARINQSIIPQPQLLVTAPLNTTGLSKGLHTYFIRFQQTSGYWSHTLSGYFFKAGESDTSAPYINAYRYWVEGIDSIITVYVSPVNPINAVATLDLSWVHKGNNYLYTQFRDSLNNWSVPSVDSFYKSAIPVAAFSTPDTFLCNNDSVHFINSSNDADLYSWHFGDGDSSSIGDPTHLYSLPGDYTVTLTAVDTASGNDSMLTRINYIHIMQSASASFTFVQNNLQFTFTNTSQNGISYYWQFGDSTHSTNTNPVHTYLHDGNYTIILTVTDSCGTINDTQYVSIVLNENDILSENDLNIFQDNDQVRILFHKDMKRCLFTFISTTGQELFFKRSENIIAGYSEKLSLENLPAGIYFLLLSDDKKSMTKIIYKL